MESFTRLGADSNAFTSFTKTSYLFSTADHLSENLDLLEELVTVAHLQKSQLSEKLSNRNVNAPRWSDSRLFFTTLANLYPNTPLAADIVGSEKSFASYPTMWQNTLLLLQTCKYVFVFSWEFFDVDTVENYFLQKKLRNLEEMVVRKEKLTLQAVKETNLRMEVSSPKLAVGIRGEQVRWQQKIATVIIFC